jgi:ABC-2 type transport system ATP-binding protein
MITAQSLSKRYGRSLVVDDVSFECERGTVTGFLGPNGAGKSTTLRMITGLTRPDRGQATINGRAFRDLPNPTRIAGTLLDASAMHPGRTGRNTLALAARIAGVPARRIDEVLDTVGLSTSAAEKCVGTYSLGMRQRLGIAQTLIGQPEVLILDEPANGLDPEGIAWMRRLLREFASGGGTVLLSSHLLAEVEATVDRLVVIRAGRLVAQGVLSDLLCTAGLVARATDQATLLAALDRAGMAHSRRDDGAVAIDTTGGVTAEDVAVLAAGAGVLLVELRQADRAGLEELFFALTSAPTPTRQEVLR